jgi:Trk K+ transport system NAD-binding subunit
LGHIIVCGLGQVGYRVTMLLLQMGEMVTVVTLEPRSEFEREVQDLGATIILGDGRDGVVLSQAKIESARALISVTDSDLTNIEITLDANDLNPGIRVVARLFDQTLARRLQESVGIDRALAMSVLAAPTFAAALIGSNAIGSFDHEDKSFSVHQDQSGEVEIRPIKHPLITVRRKRIGRFDARSFIRDIPSTLKWLLAGICVLTLISVSIFSSVMRLSPVDATYFVITTLTTTGYGDITVKEASTALKLYTCLMMILGSAAVAILYSIITDYFVSSRFAELLGRRKVNEVGHIIVVGLGNVGFRITEALTKLGHSVVAIDNNSTAKYRSLLPDSVTFIAGDGRDEETLRLAGIDSAMSIVSATHDDAVNLSSCLVAKGINPSVKTVVRLFDGGFARKVEKALDIDLALSASRISAPGFVGAAIYEDSVFSFVTAGEFVAVSPDGDGFRYDRKKLKPTSS